MPVEGITLPESSQYNYTSDVLDLFLYLHQIKSALKFHIALISYELMEGLFQETFNSF